MFDRFNAWATALLTSSKDESGQTFVEYALVLSVIVVGVLLAATWTGLTAAITGRDQARSSPPSKDAETRRSTGQGPPFGGGPDRTFIK